MMKYGQNIINCKENAISYASLADSLEAQAVGDSLDALELERGAKEAREAADAFAFYAECEG